MKSSITSFFDLKATDIDGKVVHFSELKNRKAIIVVNVASEWGLTDKNYKGLGKMHAELYDKGL